VFVVNRNVQTDTWDGKWLCLTHVILLTKK
jgi:hypothetical protein